MRTPRAVWSLLATGLVACASSQTSINLGDGGPDAARPTSDVVTVDAAQPLDAAAPADVVTPPDDVPEVPVDVPADVAAAVRARPYASHIPTDYDGSQAVPLVVLLHGYGATGLSQDLYFGLGRLADRRTFLLATPDGTLDATGRRYWNATDACCDFARSGIDDVGYVMAIIDDMSARYRVDPRRVFLVGHSNGGFLAHRIACEQSARIAAFVSLAGATWNDPARCTPTSPVAMLQVHGTADAVIAYNGGTISLGGMFPSSHTSVTRWAGYNHCDTMPTLDPARLDLDVVLPGAETHVERYAHCAAGAAELWTIENGSHIPSLTANWAALIDDFLMAHPKP